MELNKYVLVLFIGASFYTEVSLNNQKESHNGDELFVPTHDWQVVKKGQKIPKGLHIRINLETGLKEAKLLLENENPKSHAVAEISQTNDDVLEDSNLNTARYLKLSEKHIKEALKNIKSDVLDKHDDTAKQYRSYEELKKELGDINLSPKTDAELISELITRHKKTTDVAQTLAILADLEFLVHQYDNANELVKLNGFNEIIFKNLNSTDHNIKRESLKLLGSAVQNNVKVQMHALEMGAIDMLIKQLALNLDYSIKITAIYALSGILRNFPIAQLKFMKSGGLNVFIDELMEQKNLKLDLKLVTLINDLLLEHIHVLEEKSYADYEERLRQYNLVNLKERLKNYNWCNYVYTLLQNSLEIDRDDHDSIEKCLNAILNVIDTCEIIITANMKDTMVKLQTHYKQLALIDEMSKSETNDDEKMSFDYFRNMLILCQKLIEALNNQEYKDEL